MRNKIILSSASEGTVRRAIFLCFFVVGLCFSSWASRIPEIKGFLSLDDAEWGMMLLMIPLGQVVGMSFSGTLISKVGSNRVLIFAISGYALSLLGIGTAPCEPYLIAALVGFGFFGNFCNIAMNTQAVLVENHYAKPIMASFHGGWSLAGLFGGLIGLMMTIFSISTSLHFAIVSCITIIAALFNYKYLQYDASKGANELVNDKKEVEKIKIEKFLILFGIVGFFGWATEGTMTDWNGIYLKQIVGISDKYTPIGLTAYMITMTIGRFIMDKATAHYGRRIILSFCGAAIFAGMFIAVIFPMFITTIIGYMVVGFGACGVIPLLYSAAGEKSKMHTGRAITIVSTISFAGFLIGPPLIGYISQLTSLRYAFALIGICGLLTLVMSLRLKALKE